MPHRKALADNPQADSGGIDYAHYNRQARLLRAQAFADAFRFIRSSARITARLRDDAAQLEASRPGSQALDKRLPVGQGMPGAC